MKICRIEHQGVKTYALIENDGFSEVKGTPFDKMTLSGKTYKKEEVTVLAPCEPKKIIAVGLNYRKHAQELKMEMPEEPLIFLKPSSSVIGPNDEIVRPNHMSMRVDYEAELGIVIGKRSKDISKAQALKHIFGYTCVNDVTARDIQKKESQWTRAKGFDTFCPIGPYIETDFDWKNKRIYAELNGEIKQDSNTDDLIFSVEQIVSFLSRIMTLYPGDVIATGTPSGIGPMKAGDRIKIVVEGIGELSNPVK